VIPAKEYVILVDPDDRAIGKMEKMQAHREGVRHRAFSIFIFHPNGDLLLQKRALSKYHSAGLWTNTCCSHPRPGEHTANAAKRRLQEEMGMSCDLEDLFSFTYRSEFDDGLVEYEIDHVFVGYSDMGPQINPTEVEDSKFVSPATIQEAMLTTPELYTTWFRLSFDRVISNILLKQLPPSKRL
jgi:isopentenyl-diphosphate Delta-isomerase